ncbi:MAG: acyl-CoA dehydrogenase family protein [Pseudomonadota bacterium]
MTPEREQLRDALVARLGGRAPADAWQALCDAGVTALRVPEGYGGLGLPAIEAEPVFDALGALCLPTAYLDTAIVAAGLLARIDDADGAIARRIAEGARVAVTGLEPLLASDVVATPAGDGWTLSGTARIVVGGMDAEALLVIAGDALYLAGDDWAAARHPVPTIDGQMAADITLDGVSATRCAAGIAGAVEAVRDEAVAALCIEAAALMRRLVRDTVDFARQREQFGQAIGSFQVVQHRLVDMNIQALDQPDKVRGRAVSAAKVTIARAGRFVGQNAVQLHGGMGMTEELPISRLFKRLTVIEGQLGSADAHMRRFDRLRDAA